MPGLGWIPPFFAGPRLGPTVGGEPDGQGQRQDIDRHDGAADKPGYPVGQQQAPEPDEPGRGDAEKITL